ncbi:MAG: 50S ribosomal protein L3 N(5)-glutamine methyltransferase [Burkholderiaceae bacterium]|nr:50S ribosomal protein L3 N(5)-glutamine methyltransferase [Burkholderiaceae bacterium]
MTILELIQSGAKQLTEAGVAFGHGTANAFDEAAWLVLWQLGLPLDSSLEDPKIDPDSVANRPVSSDLSTKVAALFVARIATRKPAAYLTQEAWLQGIPFYVDERAIVPRSFIAELLAGDSFGSFDDWLGPHTRRVLDLCTGNGSLAVLAAMTYPDTTVVGADISVAALEVARINVDKHGLQDRISLVESDGWTGLKGQVFDLILCNPPYVNSASMAALPAEYLAEPALALAGGADGMDFIRDLLAKAPDHMSEHAVLVLEIGNERGFFEAAFPALEMVWLETSAGIDQVLLLTRDALADGI